MCIEIAKLERITHTYNTYKWRFLVMTTPHTQKETSLRYKHAYPRKAKNSPKIWQLTK